MNELIICSIVGGIQIVLSIIMIVRRKNIIATFSEIISSILLLCTLNYFSNAFAYISLKCVVFTLVEYVSVKIFLIIFMLIARIYSFNTIKELSRKNKKTGKIKLRIIQKFNKIRYWPRLNLGLPNKAGRKHSVTKVKFDEKGFPKFKSYYTVKLQKEDHHKTREQHFYIANKILYKNICSDSRLRKKFSKREIKVLSQGKTPSKYTWHHHQDPGVLQLVEYKIHSKTKHDGGYSIWGSK